MENILMNIMTVLARAGWRGVMLVLAVPVMIYFFINRPKEDNEDTEPVVTSRDLLHDINEEREKQGLYELPEVNSRSGGNTFARLDKSFNSVPDFFIKLFSKKKD